jgi:hypothetical protein
MMILRILGADEAMIQQVILQASYKGKARPHIRLMATIQFDPVDVQDFAGQPLVKAWLAGEAFTKKAQTLDYRPDVRFEALNLKGMTNYGLEAWGDAGAPVRMNDMGVRVIPTGEEG